MLSLGFFEFFKTPMKAFYGVMLVLDGLIYGLIAFLYKVFLIIASAQFFNQELYKEIAGRIQIVLGILMLFVLAYAILRGVINPDDMDAKSGMTVKSIVPNVVKTIILIAIVPTLFNYAYKAQDIILTNNVIGKIVLGQSNAEIEKIRIDAGLSAEEANKAYIEYGGTSMATLVFQTFFYPEEAPEDADEADGEVEALDPEDIVAKNAVFKELGLGNKIARVAGILACVAGGVFAITGLWIPSLFAFGACLLKKLWDWVFGKDLTLAQAYYYSASTGDFSLYVAFVDNVAKHEIHYSWFLSAIAGLFVCYIIASFCIDLGLRAVKLGYYQMIAPVPIFANLVPKGKDIFDKWVKNTLSTFLGVFIRVLVIFLVIFLIGKLPDITTNIWDSAVQGPSWGTRFFARMFLILGLLLFAKQATKLISEVFGISDGSLKLGIKDKLSDLKQPVFRAGAAIGGAATAGARNFRGSKGQGAGRITSTLGGLAGGAKKGLKYGKGADSASAMKDAAGKAGKEVNEKAAERHHAGDLFGKMLKDMAEFKDKADVWSGSGITFEEQHLLKTNKELIDAATKQAEKDKAPRDAAKAIFDANSGKAKVAFDDGEIEKYAKALGYTGVIAAPEATAAEKQAASAAQKQFIKDRGIGDFSDWKDLSYGVFEKMRASGKKLDGVNPLEQSTINGLEVYLKGLSDRIVTDIVDKTQGVDENGNWINSKRPDGGSPAQIVYSPKLEAALQDLQTTLQNNFKKYGGDHEMFKGDFAKFLADGQKSYKDMLGGMTVTIDGKLKTLGEILKKQAKLSEDYASERSRELSQLYTKIQEAEEKKAGSDGKK